MLDKREMKFEGDNLVEDQIFAEEDRLIKAKERAMHFFKSVYCLSCQDNHKLPVLDLKVSTEKRRQNEGQPTERIFSYMHEFCRKEVAYKSLISAR